MKSENALYKGTLLRLYLRRAHLPNGARVDLEVIKHPGAALIVPFIRSSSIVLLRQFRPVVKAYLYELPAGTRNGNESPLACARREIIEETGYAAHTFKKLGVIYPVPGYSTEKIVIYKASRLRKCLCKPEFDEIITVKAFDRRKIRQLFKKGGIVDAKTICALAMCGWL